MFNAEYERETWISKKILVIPEKSNVKVKVTKSVGLNFKKTANPEAGGYN